MVSKTLIRWIFVISWSFLLFNSSENGQDIMCLINFSNVYVNFMPSLTLGRILQQNALASRPTVSEQHFSTQDCEKKNLDFTIILAKDSNKLDAHQGQRWETMNADHLWYLRRHSIENWGLLLHGLRETWENPQHSLLLHPQIQLKSLPCDEQAMYSINNILTGPLRWTDGKRKRVLWSAGSTFHRGKEPCRLLATSVMLWGHVSAHELAHVWQRH